jgi:single-strand DNA-binding protein
MAKSINNVMLLGRLTNDVEVRTTPSGKNVASFSLAVDKGGKDDGADFIEVTAWEKTADLLSQYTSKGSKIIVQGRLNQQTWDDKETGKKRSKLAVVANDVTFLDSAKSSGASKDVAPQDVDDKPIDLSEIPF